MKHYRKTGKGLLGIIDKIKRPIGGVLAVRHIYSFVTTFDHNNKHRRAERSHLVSKIVRIRGAKCF